MTGIFHLRLQFFEVADHLGETKEVATKVLALAKEPLTL